MYTGASGGICSYNGTSFNTLCKSRISSRPILDEARRTVVYVEHTIDVDGFGVCPAPGCPAIPVVERGF